MTWKQGLLACLLLPVLAMAGPLDDKTPAYYVDRYGPPKSTRLDTTGHFSHPKHGAATVKGSFSVREFRDGNLRVYAVFHHPSLKLAAVRLQMQDSWTSEQTEAALAAYGGKWKPALSANFLGKTWVAPDGTVAIQLLSRIDFVSKPILELVEKTLAAADAKRKEVPKF